MYLLVIFSFFKETIPLKEQHIERTRKNLTDCILKDCIERMYHTVRESIFVKIRFCEIWSILRKLVPAKIVGNIGHIGKMFHFSLTFSLHTNTTPLCHFDPYWVYWQDMLFHFPSPYSRALWLWCNLDLLAKCFIFPTCPPSPTNLCVFNSFWAFGKTFHFSLVTLPPTMLSDFVPFWTYWQKISFFSQTSFPCPPPPSSRNPETLIHFGHISKIFHFFLKLPPPPSRSVIYFYYYYLLIVSFWCNVYLIVLLFAVKIMSHVNLESSF